MTELLAGAGARVSEVVLHVDDLDAMASFWAGALDQQPNRAGDGSWVAFTLAPGLVLLLLPPEQWEATTDRLHLALSPAAGSSTEYVERLRSLGGQVLDAPGRRSGSVALRGPEGLDLLVHRL